MTAEELFDYSHDPSRTELIAGRLFEMEPHGAAAARICRLLANHVMAHGLGEVFGAETGYVLETNPDSDVLDLGDALPGFTPAVEDLLA